MLSQRVPKENDCHEVTESSPVQPQATNSTTTAELLTMEDTRLSGNNVQPPGSSLGESSKAVPTPCKMITHLVADPCADIRQMPMNTDDEDASQTDGIPCSKAYQMMMR